jgi:hypothetical protein
MLRSNLLLDFSEPIAIFSDSRISKEELSVFLCSIGAVLGESNSFLGRLSEQDKHIWISVSNEELEYLDVSTREVIAQHLEDEPKTCIVLELSSTTGSEQLMIKFAIAFADHWSCVIRSFTEGSKIYTVQELRKDLESEI